MYSFSIFFSGSPHREEHVKVAVCHGLSGSENWKAWHDLLFVPRPLYKNQMPRPLYQGSSSFLWMQFNNNAVILDSKIKKLIQNLVIHSNEKKNWWSKMKSLKEKNLKIKTKNIVKMTEALTQTNKRTHKKMKLVNKLDKPIIHI